MSDTWKNQLFFGDNLDILKQLHAEHPQGFIDLIYIDPPFNSKRNYNVLFESIDLKDSTAQKEAFADTWTNVSYMDMLNELTDLDISLYRFLLSLDNTNISKGAISYLVTMAIRLWYMHRVLKDSGSLYLHCDPTMSHYLKILCDLIFGEKNFKNEIIWRRTGSHNTRRSFGPIHDVILFYTKSDKYLFNIIRKPYMRGHVSSRYSRDITGELKFTSGGNILTGSGRTGGDSGKVWRGFDPSAKNRHWAVPGFLTDDLDEEFHKLSLLQKLDKLFEMGRLEIKENTEWPIPVRYLKINDGQPIQDIWAYQPYTDDTVYGTSKGIDEDVAWMGTTSPERLGYPTQKPEGLLDRIILASSNEGDLVADFFCGCGTTISSAQKLKRLWLGVDISHLAVKLISKRLLDTCGDNIIKTYEIHGFPQDPGSAKELANNVKGGRLEFEDWIIEVLLDGIMNQRRNEMGFDGYRTFTINEKKYIVMMEVKSGNASPTQVNHFIKTIEDKKGAIGIFICFKEQITRNMEVIAKKEGQFSDDFGNNYCDKIQIISVEDLLEGKRPLIPSSKFETFKKAEKKSTDTDTQIKMEM